MPYTSPTEIDLSLNPVGLFNWLNEVTNFWFSNMLLITLWFIFVSGYLFANKDDYAGAFSVGGYIVSVLALLGWLFGLVSGYAFGVALGVSLISTAWLLVDRRS